MPHFLRRAFPYFALAILVGALAWAVSFGTLPKADFTFDNGNQVETIDPALATGQPENRIINGLFEGLLKNMPPEGWEQNYDGQTNIEMKPAPAMADLPEISADGLTYTFRILPGRNWSDGTPVTAEDFAWSWMRMLHPETGSRYAYQLYYVEGAEKYNTAQVEVGDAVEVELADRKDPLQLFPRGTVVRGLVRSIHKPPQPTFPEVASDEEKSKIEGDWKRKWVYAVELNAGQLLPPARSDAAETKPGEILLLSKDPTASRQHVGTLDPPAPALDRIIQCQHVLPDFDATVGVRTEGEDKLVVTLKNRTPFFSDLVAFYPLYAVQKKCIETHGSPQWTQPGKIVTNGAFKLQFRRIRDRIRMVKNPDYWDAARVQVKVIDALAVKSETTSLNMYLNGQLDWATVMPTSTIPTLKEKYATQFRSGPELTTYFYRINVTRPELRDARVRRALGMAIDKEKICELITRAGEMPATAIDPPGMAGYTAPRGPVFDVAAARKLLADAGFAGGRGLPKIEILYNDLDAHRTIAETIQQMWKENLGVDAELRGLEWGVYLDATHKLDYEVARAGWVADYADPNTFLDMFVTGGENNQTGWSNARYDELIRSAASEPDPARRMEMLQLAETILLDEQPIIPIYFRVSKNLVQPHVQGFFNNVQDEHPLKLIKVVRP